MIDARPVTSPVSSYPRRAYAWFVVGVLVLVSIVGYVDRQIVALMVQPIKADLALSDTAVGWLYSSFAIFFAAAGLPLAYLADRVHRIRLISLALAFWSLMSIGSGLARGFVPLLLTRIGVGIGEAALTPTGHSLIGDYFPRRKIPVAIAVLQLSGTLGTGFAFFAGGYVVDWVTHMPPTEWPLVGLIKPWQTAFIVVGIPGTLVLLLFLLVREPPRRVASDDRSVLQMDFRPVGRFYRKHWLTMLTHHVGFGSMALAGYAIIFWAPTFFVRIHGSTPRELALILGIAYSVGGTAGTYLGARIGQRLYARGHFDWPFRGTLAWAWLMLPLTWVITTTQSVSIAAALFTPLVVFVNVPFGMSFGALPVIAPARLRAQVAAIYLIVGSAVGMGLGPVVLGAVSDHIYPAPDGVRHSLMLVVTACAPLWFALLWIGRPHFAATLREAERLSECESTDE